MRESRQSVLFLVPDLASCGEGAAARVLARMLPADQFRVTMGFLGRTQESERAELEAVGIAVESIPIRYAMDIAGARGLRRIVRELQPDLVHSWGVSATRFARLVLSHDRLNGNVPRLVVSQAANPGGGVGGWLTVRQLRRADRVIPRTRADGDRYRRLGVPAERLTLIAPAAAAPVLPTDRDALCRELDVPVTARILVTGGRSEGGIGPKDAMIAFDMLRYDARDIYLVVLGAGTEASSLERLGRSLAFDDFRVRFALDRQDWAGVINLAAAVLATSPRGGIEAALTAMAAGKPVVGWATADLSEIVEDKVSGLLVPPGDRTALAAAIRSLLDNCGHARRLGEAGRTRAAERFNPSRMAEQFTRLYQELAPAHAAV